MPTATPALDLVFPPFRLDVAGEQLWRGSQAVRLRPGNLAVLRHLAENAGRLVTWEELRGKVWPGTSVSQAVLRSAIRDLRRALQDGATAPRFIETVARRGYRFIAPVSRVRPAPAAGAAQAQPPGTGAGLVGREAELAQLQGWLETALGGERQVVFVTGEPGIGKTALVDAFLQEAAATARWWVGRGQCVEHYGAGEAYGPVLEALGRLGGAREGERLVAVLARHAPTWLAQMPALAGEDELALLLRRAPGTLPQRMLGELAEALEVLTATQPLVLVIEDLQWVDYSTLELIATLARRPEEARLLLIGTYRPVDVIVHGHPLRGIEQELRAHGHCQGLPLGCLPEAAVAAWVTARFPGREIPAGLARLVYHRTDGNPLFMINVVDYLVRQGLVIEADTDVKLTAGPRELEGVVPDSLRQMIDKRVESLSENDQRTLEAASVAGTEFAAAVVAAGLGEEHAAVEERCHRLVRRGQFLGQAGTEEWPDGTVSARYAFAHALYQTVLYDRVPAGRRAELHRRVAEREEQGQQDQAGARAALLAMHFERGRDYRRAVKYLGQAADNALRLRRSDRSPDQGARTARHLPRWS